MCVLQQIDSTALWVDFLHKQDQDSRNRLIRHYLSIVKIAAERIHARLPASVDLDDLIGAGVFGLIKAINAFKPEIGVPFKAYCLQRVRGEILDDLRKKDWVPRLVRDSAKKLQAVTENLQMLHNRMPTEIELANELEMDIDKFRKFQRNANAVCFMSLDDQLSDSDNDRAFREIDAVADPRSVDPFLIVQRRDLREYFTKGFTIPEKLIIILYYYEELTMKEIGAALGISESRVCQMHSSIIARLKSHLTRQPESILTSCTA